MKVPNTLNATQKAIIYRRQKQLFCSYDRLTNFDISTLIKACHDTLYNADENLLLLASLLSGRTINALLDVDLDLRIKSNISTPEKSAAFVNPPKLVPLDSLKIRDEFALDSNTFGEVVLFPESLAVALYKVREKKLSSSSIIKKSSRFLSVLNKQKNTRLSLSRISNQLYSWCMASGVSETIYSALTGQRENYHSGNFYTRLSNAILLSTLQKYHRDIYKEHIYLIPKLPNIKAQNFWGSRRVVKTKKVTDYLDRFRFQIFEARRMRYWDILHNAMTLYCFSIMQISTGVRPTNRLLGNLHAFDRTNRTVLIRDKGEKSTRLIYLNNLAFRQLEEYCEFLQDIAKLLRFVAPHHYRKVERKLAGRSNLFSLLKWDVDNTEKGNRKMMTDSTFYYFPMPANWHRHLLRTTLESINTPPHLLDYFFDHQTLVTMRHNDAFNAISAQEMQSIANTIESTLLKPLNIRGVQNPLGIKYDTRR